MKESKARTFFEGKKVLVAGGSGFIGTHLVDKLISYGAIVRATQYRSPLRLDSSEIEIMPADLRIYEDCIRVTRDMQFVFMAAANSSGADVIQNSPLVHLTPNVIMNTQLLEASYEAGVTKFCFISSNTVYPVSDLPMKEADVNDEFFDKYYIVGRMKRFAEILCEIYAQRVSPSMSTLVIRPGNLYGPFDKFSWKESKVVAASIRKVVEGHDPIEIWGDGSDIKDFLFVEDFVEGLLSCFMLPDSFDVFNIASGHSVSIKKLIDLLLKIYSVDDRSISFDASKPTMIPQRHICIDKVTQATGWTPTTSLSLGLSKTIDWYLENRSL